MTKDQIRTIFMQRGFTIKEGQDDLKDYVYEAANDFIRARDEEACALLADGGKDSSGAEPVEESDVRPKERLCGGSHVTCNGVDYCLGHPSCRDIANERAKKEQK
jgi:hypothetical protein